MTYETHILAREGYMNEKGEHVTTRVVAVAVELETGVTADAAGTDDESVIAAAAEALEAEILDRKRLKEESAARAAEDHVVRLARLEAIVREAGLSG